jgi:hypothetical protein
LQQPSSKKPHIPISEPAHAFCQITPGLELGIYDCVDVNLGETMADEGSKVFRETSESVVTSLSHLCQYAEKINLEYNKSP